MMQDFSGDFGWLDFMEVAAVLESNIVGCCKGRVSLLGWYEGELWDIPNDRTDGMLLLPAPFF